VKRDDESWLKNLKYHWENCKKMLKKVLPDLMRVIKLFKKAGWNIIRKLQVMPKRNHPIVLSRIEIE